MQEFGKFAISGVFRQAAPYPLHIVVATATASYCFSRPRRFNFCLTHLTMESPASHSLHGSTPAWTAFSVKAGKNRMGIARQ